MNKFQHLGKLWSYIKSYFCFSVFSAHCCLVTHNLVTKGFTFHPPSMQYNDLFFYTFKLSHLKVVYLQSWRWKMFIHMTLYVNKCHKSQWAKMCIIVCTVHRKLMGGAASIFIMQQVDSNVTVHSSILFSHYTAQGCMKQKNCNVYWYKQGRFVVSWEYNQ